MQNNAGTMRQVIIVLIALLALSIFMPTMWAKSPGTAGVLINSNPSLTAPADTPLLTTPTMADFLNDSWMPSSFVAPTINATDALKNGTPKGTTYAIYDFANDKVSTTPSYKAVATNNAVSGSGEQSILNVLGPDYSPATADVQVIPTAPYKLHQMS